MLWPTGPSLQGWPSLQRQLVCRGTKLSHFRLRPARSPPASAFSFLEKLRLNPDFPAQLRPASEPLPTGERTAHSLHGFSRVAVLQGRHTEPAWSVQMSEFC